MAVVNATQTLTLAGNAVDAETVTIGGQVYTWETGALDASGKVLVGASAAASIQNLFDAINGTGTPGTQYHASTPLNPVVRASALTATTLVVQSKLGGVIGNLIAVAEAMTQGSWGAANLAGGTGDLGLDIKNFLLSSGAQMSADVAQFLREIAYDPASV